MFNNVKREDVELSLMAIAVFIAFGLVFYFAPKRSEVVVINCSLSEISPDFTLQMREACRQARAQNYQKDLQKPK